MPCRCLHEHLWGGGRTERLPPFLYRSTSAATVGARQLPRSGCAVVDMPTQATLWACSLILRTSGIHPVRRNELYWEASRRDLEPIEACCQSSPPQSEKHARAAANRAGSPEPLYRHGCSHWRVEARLRCCASVAACADVGIPCQASRWARIYRAASPGS